MSCDKTWKQKMGNEIAGMMEVYRSSVSKRTVLTPGQKAEKVSDARFWLERGVELALNVVRREIQ